MAEDSKTLLVSKNVKEILYLLNKESGVLERNIQMILSYENKEEDKTDFFILLGDSENGDKWDGYSVKYLKSGSKVITIGNKLLDDYVEILHTFIINPIENGFPIFDRGHLQKFRRKIKKIKSFN